jgi:hypothetical protein
MKCVHLVVLAALATLGGCITKRTGDNTFEIHGIASTVDRRAKNACGKTDSGQRIHGSITQLEYEPSRTTTGYSTSSQSITGSCDRSGTCLTTTSTTSTPITWTRAPRKRVQVSCPSY